jgi:hypothetical protein
MIKRKSRFTSIQRPLATFPGRVVVVNDVYQLSALRLRLYGFQAVLTYQTPRGGNIIVPSS